MATLTQIADPDDSDEGAELGTEILTFQNGTVVVPETPPATVKPKWVLKKLTARHKRIVNLKIAGLQREDIAQMVKCTPEYISMLLQQELVKSYMAERNADVDQDLKDLTKAAVDTLRSTVDSPDDKVALASAQTILRANGKLGGPPVDEEKLTAEDVVAKLFSISNSNVQINVAQKE